jgi:hypothetical protein
MTNDLTADLRRSIADTRAALTRARAAAVGIRLTSCPVVPRFTSVVDQFDC